MSRCDAPDPPVYLSMLTGGQYQFSCRCLICPRCGQHTGNSTQGHLWGFCQVTGTFRSRHLCCPGNCELETRSAA